MTANKEEDISADSEASWRRPEWLTFSTEDKRLAVVTIAATLVANIATLMIVAFALAANHAMNVLAKLDDRNLNLPAWAVFIVCGIAIFASVIFSIKRVRQSTFAIMLEIAGGILGFLWCVFILFALLGQLAAIK